MHSKLSKGAATRLLCLLVGLGLIAALVAGCGGGSSSSATGSTKSSEAEGGAGSSKVAGKKIGYIDTFATAAVQIRFRKAFEEAADHLGWSVQLEDAAGEQEKALTAARSMINSGVDAIVTSSLPGEWLLPIIPEAEAKGIPIVELVVREPQSGIYTGQVIEKQGPSSEKLVEQVKKEFPNGGEVAILYIEEVHLQVERLEGLEKGLKGSNIKVVATQSIPLTELPNVQKATVDLLNAHPNLQAFITTADVQNPEVIAGLRTAGNKKVKLLSYYADSVNVATMKANPKQFVAVVDSGIAEVSWIAAGELASYFTGGEIKELQEPEYTPVIVTPSEITPSMEAEEGPVPFSKIGEPFYKEWETKFGTSG